MNKHSFVKRATLQVLANKLSQPDSYKTDLTGLTKTKLIEFANSIGLELNSKLKKSDLIESIESSKNFVDYERENRLVGLLK